MDFLQGLFDLYASGASLVFAPRALLLIVLGIVVGIVFGALPGLSSTMALALFLPFTFGMSPAEAMVFLIAIYNSSVYAGALTAILVNIPGTPSAIATGLDGYPLACRGEAGRAIGVATTASFLGGLFGLAVLVLFSPLVAGVARLFGSWEYALLAVLALTLIAYVSTASLVRGLLGGVLGLLLASVGDDPIMAFPRFSGGVAELHDGFNMVVLMIGFFGFAELFSELENKAKVSVEQKVVGLLKSVREVARYWAALVRSSLVGVWVGMMPGAGGAIASIAAYGLAKRVSREEALYGRGSPEGLVAAESANNASVGGALVPTLTMGIPGDPMTAVLIGALMIHGVAPGPELYTKSPQLVSAIFLGFGVGLFVMLALGLLAARPFARLIACPRHLVLGVIAVLCVLGAYSIHNSLFDVAVAVAFGFVGYLLKKVDVHPAPIILGVVLGPMLETNLRRAILLGEGDLSPFVTRPASLAMVFAIVAILFGPPLWRRLKRAAGGRASSAPR